MYRIAICDDVAAELDKTEQLLKEYEREHPRTAFSIECFDHAEKLIDMVREKDYKPDLMLLDIYMPGKMGIDAARELRETGNQSRIIFLTTSREHALEAFGVGAVQYLVKPVEKEALFPVLDRVLGEIARMQSKYLLLRIEGRIRRVAVDDIVYCEAQGKTQHLYLKDGTQRLLRITIAEICGMLSCYQKFVRIGVAYLVNLEHIDSLNAQELHLDSGKKIYLPRGSYQMLKERYFDYYCGEGAVVK